MQNAWVVRAYPHYNYCINRFLGESFVAIGWAGIGSLEGVLKRDEIIKILSKQYPDDSRRSLGQSAGTIYRFITEIQEGDYVVVPDGDSIYFGKISGPYVYSSIYDSDDTGFPHQRPVNWLLGGRPVQRTLLHDDLHQLLKNRLAVYQICYSEVDRQVQRLNQFIRC